MNIWRTHRLVWHHIRSETRLCTVTFVIHHIHGHNYKRGQLRTRTLNEFLFADDKSLVHESKERLQEHTSSLNSTCEEYNMKIRINRTETMKVSRTPATLNININNTNLKQVKEFKYLGSIFTEDGRMNREIENKIQKANNVSYQFAPLLKYSNIPMETKQQNHKLHLHINTHIPMPNLDHDQASAEQNYNLPTEMLMESCQQDQKRHDPQHPNQRNGRNSALRTRSAHNFTFYSALRTRLDPNITFYSPLRTRMAHNFTIYSALRTRLTLISHSTAF